MSVHCTLTAAGLGRCDRCRRVALRNHYADWATTGPSTPPPVLRRPGVFCGPCGMELFGWKAFGI